ncbi:MAG: MSMEG_0569 family flavin-dependent oxidoreductase [Hyphomicrobiales bacterium]
MTQHSDTIVIGGGQAGLCASYYLTKGDIDHLVFDRGEIGDTWRKRWDSFCLVTPNWCCKLPDFEYDGDDPHGFMLRDEIVGYVERFAESFSPPYRSGIEVLGVHLNDGERRFSIETSQGSYTARNLIVATGTHQHARVPSLDSKFSDNLTRMHTAAYQNPESLREGGVLIVGSGQSGCQLADDLLKAGRDVHLCVGNAGRIPRRYRGRDILEWDDITRYFDLVVDDHPKGHDIRFQPHPHMTGRDGGRTIDLRQFALDGVHLYGRLADVTGTTVHFEDNLAASLDFADEMCRQNAKDIDEYIAQSGISAPEPDLDAVEWQPNKQPLHLDLVDAEVTTVIYATGFGRDFSWLNVPVFDDTGYPRYKRGVTDIAGLYFVGLHWMHTQGSGLFYGVGRDAEHVVGHLLQNSSS